MATRANQWIWAHVMQTMMLRLNSNPDTLPFVGDIVDFYVVRGNLSSDLRNLRIQYKWSVECVDEDQVGRVQITVLRKDNNPENPRTITLDFNDPECLEKLSPEEWRVVETIIDSENTSWSNNPFKFS